MRAKTKKEHNNNKKDIIIRMPLEIFLKSYDFMILNNKHEIIRTLKLYQIYTNECELHGKTHPR